MLIRRFFGRKSERFQLHFTEDGCEALDFLLKKGKYASAPSPDLVLLDLNLPLKDGRQVLAEIKKYPVIQYIPIFVVTTSQSTEDKDRCRDLGAEQFLSKPSELKAFDEMLHNIAAWLEQKRKNK